VTAQNGHPVRVFKKEREMNKIIENIYMCECRPTMKASNRSYFRDTHTVTAQKGHPVIKRDDKIVRNEEHK
jgi:hypothetical protein